MNKIPYEINLTRPYEDDLEKGVQREECSICLDNAELTHTNWVQLKVCSHTFHKSCIDTWMVNHIDPVCPLCLRKIYQKNESNQSIIIIDEVERERRERREIREMLERREMRERREIIERRERIDQEGVERERRVIMRREIEEKCLCVCSCLCCLAVFIVPSVMILIGKN